MKTRGRYADFISEFYRKHFPESKELGKDVCDVRSYCSHSDERKQFRVHLLQKLLYLALAFRSSHQGALLFDAHRCRRLPGSLFSKRGHNMRIASAARFIRRFYAPGLHLRGIPTNRRDHDSIFRRAKDQVRGTKLEEPSRIPSLQPR